MYIQKYTGFNWDEGNREKCQKHDVSCEEVEGLFASDVTVLPDEEHSTPDEQRYRAIGTTDDDRYVFIVFTLRIVSGETLIRPISARYMHAKEIERYVEENPDV